MEPKFVNQFTRTDEVDHEVLRYTSFQSPSSIIAYGATGLTVLMLLIYFIPFPPSFPSLDNKDTIITGLALCCFGFVLLIWIIKIIRYFRQLSISRKRIRETTNDTGELHVTATLTQTELTYISDNMDKEIVIPVSQIKKGVETRNYYLIITDAKLAYAFQKGCFTTGKEEDFAPFVTKMISESKTKK